YSIVRLRVRTSNKGLEIRRVLARSSQGAATLGITPRALVVLSGIGSAALAVSASCGSRASWSSCPRSATLARGRVAVAPIVHRKGTLSGRTRKRGATGSPSASAVLRWFLPRRSTSGIGCDRRLGLDGLRCLDVVVELPVGHDRGGRVALSLLPPVLLS